jgi:hypothetical protein
MPQQPELPALPLEQWESTKETLRLWTQIVGKVRLATAPPQNHWWHVTLYVDRAGSRPAGYRIAGATSTSRSTSLPMSSSRVQAGASWPPSHSRTESPSRRSTSASSGSSAASGSTSRSTPRRTGSRSRHPSPKTRSMPPTIATRWSDSGKRCAGAIVCCRSSPAGSAARRARFISSGTVSTWPSPASPDGARPETPSADAVTREAYSHEVISFGFWPGDEKIRLAAFYSYTPAGRPRGRETVTRWRSRGREGRCR